MMGDGRFLIVEVESKGRRQCPLQKRGADAQHSSIKPHFGW